MKYITIILLAWMSVTNQAGQEGYSCKDAKISIYSKAAIQDIAAETTSGTSYFNPTTGELSFSLNIKSLVFPKSLMQDHFNSEYMESDKYPKATFKGKIQEKIDLDKKGTFPITVAGDLEMHGVSQPRTIKGNITIDNGSIIMTSDFNVKSVDHHIKMPRLFFHNVGEVVQVKVSATYHK